jgi:tetratricopeptide (TPR) repeat protein
LPDTEENKRKQIEIRLLISTPMLIINFPEGSLQNFKEGEKVAEEVRDKRSLAIFHSYLSNLYSMTGDPVLGMKYSETSFQEAEKIEDVDLMAPVGYTLCISYMVQNVYLKMADVASKVIKVLEKTKRESEFFGRPMNVYVAMHYFYGFASVYLGKFDEAETLCEKGLLFAHSIDHLPSLGIAEFGYAQLYGLKGDGRSTLDHAEKALKYYEEGDIHHLMPYVFLFIGIGHYLLGELESAKNNLDKGLKMLKGVGVSMGMSNFHRYLSMVHLDSGELESAQSYAEKAIKLAKQNKERGYEGNSWTILGRILGKQEPNKMEEAENNILRGIKILKELRMKPSVSIGNLWLGELYAYSGQREKAMENLKTAEAMFQEMGMNYYLTKTKEVLEKI